MKPARDTSVFVIAEAGVNHNGSLERARALVAAAAKAGADAVKFQTFKAEKVAAATAPKAEYQKAATGAGESQLEMIRKLELPDAAFQALAQDAVDLGIEFMSTPFDADSLDFLVRTVGMKRLKIPSGEITNGPFLLAAARAGLPLVVSTGMATMAEIEDALGVIAYGITGAAEPPGAGAFARAYAAARDRLASLVTLLHCTTEYPAPYAEVHLRAMDTMRARFGLAVGYSDHTPGIAVPIAAAALGAVAIEKHFTMDRALPGPDHKASLEPGELGEMVRAIRVVEAALGETVKAPQPSERHNMAVARRSVVAARPIKKGEAFAPAMLDAKRPGTGISPMRHWELLGKTAPRDFAPDEAIEDEAIEEGTAKT
ncbi:MAG: N-acetylneuraminate synthase [Alphaproteobacteria bacterium]